MELNERMKDAINNSFSIFGKGNVVIGELFRISPNYTTYPLAAFDSYFITQDKDGKRVYETIDNHNMNNYKEQIESRDLYYKEINKCYTNVTYLLPGLLTKIVSNVTIEFIDSVVIIDYQTDCKRYGNMDAYTGQDSTFYANQDIVNTYRVSGEMKYKLNGTFASIFLALVTADSKPPMIYISENEHSEEYYIDQLGFEIDDCQSNLNIPVNMTSYVTKVTNFNPNIQIASTNMKIDSITADYKKYKITVADPEDKFSNYVSQNTETKQIFPYVNFTEETDLLDMLTRGKTKDYKDKDIYKKINYSLAGLIPLEYVYRNHYNPDDVLNFYSDEETEAIIHNNLSRVKGIEDPKEFYETLKDVIAQYIDTESFELYKMHMYVVNDKSDSLAFYFYYAEDYKPRETNYSDLAIKFYNISTDDVNFTITHGNSVPSVLMMSHSASTIKVVQFDLDFNELHSHTVQSVHYDAAEGLSYGADHLTIISTDKDGRERYNEISFFDQHNDTGAGMNKSVIIKGSEGFVTYDLDREIIVVDGNSEMEARKALDEDVIYMKNYVDVLVRVIIK